MFSLVEENYLKAIYHLSEAGKKPVSTNALASTMENKAASVTDMLKRLATKEVISYEKYRGVNVTHKGKLAALRIIRKHRLWETFLVEKLDFTWDEVHDVAEQLEHIRSPLLIEKLDEYLGYPKIDPHGHPIPDKNGIIHSKKASPLCEQEITELLFLREVRNAQPAFLQYLSKIGIQLGVPIQILEKIDFDGSLQVKINKKTTVLLTREVAENLYVSP